MWQKLFFRYDRWSLCKRIILLLGLLLLITVMWYLLFMHHLLAQTKRVKTTNQYELAIANQLSALYQRRADFVFRQDLTQLELKQVLESLTSGAGELSVTRFTDGAKHAYPGGAQQYSLASQVLGAPLMPALVQKNVKVRLKGGFYDFRDYLSALQNSQYTIYFKRVDFNMKAYPKAEIVLDVFTLEGQ